MISGLALLFPWSDSLRLWPTAGINYVAVIFYLLGVVVALRSLRLRGTKSVLGHAGAVTLYLASVLTYEVAVFPALLSGALYLTRTSPRRALTRWAADVTVGVAGTLISVVAIAWPRFAAGSSAGIRVSGSPLIVDTSVSCSAS